MRLLLPLNLPDDVAHVPMLRRVSREALSSCKVSPRDVDDLELLIGELATNAVRHARAPNFRVDLELYEGFAVVTVTDAGRGFRREKVPQPGTERLGPSAWTMVRESMASRGSASAGGDCRSRRPWRKR